MATTRGVHLSNKVSTQEALCDELQHKIDRNHFYA
jgi:hypothetical protein